MSGTIDTGEFISALDALAKERRINKDVLFAAIESALISAYKKNFGKSANVRASIDREKGTVEVFARKTVVEEVEDPQVEISLDEARAIHPKYEIGDLAELRATPREFGRIAAQTAKQVVVQHIREAERGVIYDEYIEKENEILTAIVQRVDNRQGCGGVGPHRRPARTQPADARRGVQCQRPAQGHVLEVNKMSRGPQVLVSRTHPGLVKRLFELEVPEIRQGIVQIKSIAREADTAHQDGRLLHRSDDRAGGFVRGPAPYAH